MRGLDARRLRTALLATLAAVTMLCLAARADAQPGAPQITVNLSADEVAIDEPFRIELRVVAEGNDLPTNPKLRPPRRLNVMGPQLSRQQIQTRIGGYTSTKQHLSAVWYLYSHKPGSFVIPAPSVEIGGSTFSAGSTMRVRVVKGKPRPSSPRRPSMKIGPGGGFSFNVPFGFDFDFGGDVFPNVERDHLDESGEQLALDYLPEREVFIRAVTDKTTAVVGEQITLTFYLYFERLGMNRRAQEQREAPLSDFLRMAMVEERGEHLPRRTRVAGRRYRVVLLDRIAIFPVRSGKLHTGSMSLKFPLRGTTGLTARLSNDIAIDVAEPPMADRPAGYRLGDVGSYRLTAKVEPREITAGDTVAVQIRLKGVGAVPHSIKVPERTGIEWLGPETKGEVRDVGGRISGWRSFGYAVRLHEQGDVPLGAVVLPYYDPEQGEYAVTRVELGNVLVQPGKSPKGASLGADGGTLDSDDPDPFANLGSVRMAISPEDTGPRGLALRTFWSLVLLPPVGVVLLAGLARSGRRLRKRWAARQRDAQTLAARALKDTKRAEDPKDAAAAAERAIVHAIEAACGVKARGVLLDELPARLVAGGLSEELARQSCEALQECSAIRFEPAPSEQTARELASRTKRLVKALGKAAPSPAAPPSDG